MASVTPALDHAHIDATMPLRFLSCLGVSLLVLDFLHSGSALLPRSFLRSSSSAFMLGLARLGFVFPLPVPDYVHPSLPSPIRSTAHMGTSTFTLDLLHLKSSLSVQASCRVESQALTLGLARIESVFSSSVLDSVHMGASLFAQSSA